jgi:hypothetical protein
MFKNYLSGFLGDLLGKSVGCHFHIRLDSDIVMLLT